MIEPAGWQSPVSKLYKTLCRPHRGEVSGFHIAGITAVTRAIRNLCS